MQLVIKESIGTDQVGWFIIQKIDDTRESHGYRKLATLTRPIQYAHESKEAL
jgi:hypothetical protein